MIRDLIVIPVAWPTMGLLAQSVPSLDPGWGQFFANGVAVGVLAFYVLYDIKVRGPAQQKTFSDSLEAIRAAFQKEQAESRQASVLEQAALRLHYDKEIGEYRQMLRENMQAMRVAVHDVKDTANVVMTNQNLRAVEQEERDVARDKKYPRAAE